MSCPSPEYCAMNGCSANGCSRIEWSPREVGAYTPVPRVDFSVSSAVSVIIGLGALIACVSLFFIGG